MLGRLVAYLATGAGSSAVFFANIETFSVRDFSQAETWLNFNVLVTIAAAGAAALCVFLTVQNVLSATNFYKQSLEKHDANEEKLILLDERLKKLNSELISLKWSDALRNETSEDAVAWKRVSVSLDSVLYHGFQKNYPDSKYHEGAQSHLNQLSHWDRIKKKDPFEIYRFLLSGPFEALRQEVEAELAKSIKRAKTQFREDLLNWTLAPLLPLFILIYIVPVSLYYLFHDLLSGERFGPLVALISYWVLETGRSITVWLSQQPFVTDPAFVDRSHTWLEVNTLVWVTGGLSVLLIALSLYLTAVIVLAPLFRHAEAYIEGKLEVAERQHATIYEGLI